MADYRLSADAKRDLIDIADYTLDVFGPSKSYEYKNNLLNALTLLSKHPHLGQSFSDVKPGMRRFHEASHAIYYLPSIDFIYIYRILHQSQDPLKHL